MVTDPGGGEGGSVSRQFKRPGKFPLHNRFSILTCYRYTAAAAGARGAVSGQNRVYPAFFDQIINIEGRPPVALAVSCAVCETKVVVGAHERLQQGVNLEGTRGGSGGGLPDVHTVEPPRVAPPPFPSLPEALDGIKVAHNSPAELGKPPQHGTFDNASKRNRERLGDERLNGGQLGRGSGG